MGGVDLKVWPGQPLPPRVSLEAVATVGDLSTKGVEQGAEDRIEQENCQHGGEVQTSQGWNNCSKEVEVGVRKLAQDRKRWIVPVHIGKPTE